MQINKRIRHVVVLLGMLMVFAPVTAQQDDVPVSESIQMEPFVNDLEMGIPAQDVYIDANMVVRPEGELTEELLAQPLYSIPFNNPPDFLEEPFDVGPYPQDAALGFTLEEFLSATGSGTYTKDGDRATLDLTFENLIPNGVYTLWCVELDFVTPAMVDEPCGEPEDSTFVADENGRGHVVTEMNTLPPSSDDKLYSISLAYHSDGQTYGESAGEFGHNVHVQISHDILPETNERDVVELNNWLSDMAMGVPAQDVYVDANMVVRPEGEITEAMLNEPLYTVPFNNPPDFFEEPFDVGPYPADAPLGFTLGEWLAATGTGTYTVEGDTAVLDMSFENLVPEGVYTIWCLELNFAEMAITEELPCGDRDGSENEFMADEDGSGGIIIEIEPLPPSTEDIIYEVALAYHSDGQTYGERAGEFGHNVHVQLVYDFLPPDSDAD